VNAQEDGQLSRLQVLKNALKKFGNCKHSVRSWDMENTCDRYLGGFRGALDVGHVVADGRHAVVAARHVETSEWYADFPECHVAVNWRTIRRYRWMSLFFGGY